MKKLLIFAALILAVGVGHAAQLPLHNRIVFTRGAVDSPRDELVWTMNADGSDQKRVWRVPKGYGQFGGFSRDGKLALSFNRFNLYLHDLQTKHFERILLWNDGWGTNIQQPTFSPDGKQILVEIGSAVANDSNTLILRLQTGKSYLSRNEIENATIHPTGQDVPKANLWSAPRWSADGKRIIAVGGLSYSYARPETAEAQSEIWIMNADGTQAKQVTKSSAWEFYPASNADGGRIAFMRRFDTDHSDVGFYSCNLWIFDVAGQSEKTLTFFPETYSEMLAKGVSTVPFNPLFSPDGTQLAFEQANISLRGDKPPVGGIFRIDADGTNQKRLGDGRLIQWIW